MLTRHPCPSPPEVGPLLLNIAIQVWWRQGFGQTTLEIVSNPPCPTSDAWWDYVRDLGLRLQRARIAKGMSQEAVAHAAGISTFTYQKFEKGESKPGTPMNPRLTTLVALSHTLEIGIGELLEG